MDDRERKEKGGPIIMTERFFLPLLSYMHIDDEDKEQIHIYMPHTLVYLTNIYA